MIRDVDWLRAYSCTMIVFHVNDRSNESNQLNEARIMVIISFHEPFDLHLSVDFGYETPPLPALLVVNSTPAPTLLRTQGNHAT